MRVYLELNDGPQQKGVAVGTVANSELPAKLQEFTLNDMWGEPRSISEWAGKPLLINFWATWCAPCRREMPLFETLHKQRDDVQVLGIAIDRPADVQTWMAEAGFSYETLVGESDAMKVSEQFGLSGLGLPFTVTVNGKGDILSVFIGELDAGELQELADTVVANENGKIDVATARQRLAEL